MSDTPRPPQPPRDVLTPGRDITHQHFQPGDRIAVLKGVLGNQLWGDAMTVITPSWHTPTDEDGWRLRNPEGGQQTYITGHPRYLVHLHRRCADCLIYVRALEDYLIPKYSGSNGVIDLGWYSVTDLNQLVHINDARSGR